jgi:L-alanine-DL-glutamate epimerase-like enolase superfamily enzyme
MTDMPQTDIVIRDATLRYEDYRYRTPIKFGGVALDRVTLLTATVTVETAAGRTAVGTGSMPLGNVWAWPGQPYDTTLGGMKIAAERIAKVYRDCTLLDHPVAITHTLEPVLFEEAVGVVPGIPPLGILVAASPFDAALHDAFGKVHGRNCYHTYGPDLFNRDLGEYLGRDYQGESLGDYVHREPAPTLPLYHLVGALDPLTAADGLTHLKIKLNCDDLAWDVQRVVGVDRVAAGVADRLWHYSLDFNERCPNVDYLLEFLQTLQSLSKPGYDRVQYIEQPTHRYLANGYPVHAVAKQKPVVMDESLLDLETMHVAMDYGYTGVAFKACKGQTQSLLLAAAAQKLGLFRCVQDLTCPGASLIHSAGLAAHIPGVMAIESNGRQYCPAANAGWDERFPGLFTIRGGVMPTGQLTGPGLGATG